MGINPTTGMLDNAVAIKITDEIVRCTQCGSVQHLPTIITQWEKARSRRDQANLTGPECNVCHAVLRIS